MKIENINLDNIKVVITKKGVSETAIYNKESFIEEFGITPTQYREMKEKEETNA